MKLLDDINNKRIDASDNFKNCLIMRVGEKKVFNFITRY